MEEILDLKDIKEDMIGYHIVTKIYEIRDDFLFIDEPIDYKSLIMNLKVLDYITEINFVYSAGVGILDEIKEVTKVGNLLNFQVFLDPLQTVDEVTFTGENLQNFKLKINF